MSFKLLTEHHLAFLSFKGDCAGSSETTLVKIPHCWKSHVGTQFTSSLTVGDPEGVQGFAQTPSHPAPETKLFHFYGIYKTIDIKSAK